MRATPRMSCSRTTPGLSTSNAVVEPGSSTVVSIASSSVTVSQRRSLTWMHAACACASGVCVMMRLCLCQLSHGAREKTTLHHPPNFRPISAAQLGPPCQGGRALAQWPAGPVAGSCSTLAPEPQGMTTPSAKEGGRELNSTTFCCSCSLWCSASRDPRRRGCCAHITMAAFLQGKSLQASGKL